jgi:hypothetical protein
VWTEVLLVRAPGDGARNRNGGRGGERGREEKGGNF